ncbi:MAG: hypothetical protein V1787_05165 [Candidatus Micrarchaeota archaeon]
MKAFVVFMGGIRGLGKSKYAAIAVMNQPGFRLLDLGQALHYLAEHTFGKTLADLAPDENEAIGRKCCAEAESGSGITLLDGSFANYADHKLIPQPLIPAPLLERIDAFILVESDAETAAWLRERRGFPPELLDRKAIEDELAVEHRMADDVVARMGKHLYVLKRERNVDFTELLSDAVRALAPAKESDESENG